MLGKRPHQMIGRLSETFVSSNHGRFLDAATSPRSPLDYKIQSPRGLKTYDLGGVGVGLGIVAALEKSSGGDGGHEILAKYAICSTNLNRSHPIPVNSGKICERFKGGGGCFEEMGMESLENYTFVTSRGPDKSFTKVYYDGVEHGRKGHDRTVFDTRCDNFGVVPMSKGLQPSFVEEDLSVYPTSDFLSSCHLCKKKLHGKDIYMYRGEKAFCSVECRASQIMIDERKEQCSSEVSRSADVSSSTYARSPIFSTGIVAI